MSIKDYNGITIDLSRDKLLEEPAKILLKEKYMLKGEHSPQEAFARTALAYSFGDKKFAQRIYDYASNLYFMYASPVLSNAPKEGDEPKGMPISCFLTYVEDSIQGLNEHTTEERWLSVKGGGVGGYWGKVRYMSEKSPGVIPFLHTVDADMVAYKQGTTRRGNYAAYLDISHPDIQEFLQIRVPTGGDVNRKCLNLHQAINISDKFLKALENNEEWEFICPHSGDVKGRESARKLFEEILKVRARTGEPYITYMDEANRKLNPILKKKGLKIHSSNLCSEIYLPTGRDPETDLMRTAVCCLSSLNLEKYDEWKDTEIVQDLVKFLDNVLQFFIRKAPPCLANSIYSAIQERSIGLGTMGFHSYLQSKGIPLEGVVSKSLNMKIFKEIKEKALLGTQNLATYFGEGTKLNNQQLYTVKDKNYKDTYVKFITTKEDLERWNLQDQFGVRANEKMPIIFTKVGIYKDAYSTFTKEFKEILEIKDWKQFSLLNKIILSKNVIEVHFSLSKLDSILRSIGRNSHLLAIAPNSNNSFICSTSPSIEPWSANSFVHSNRVGSFEIRNKYLDRLIREKLDSQFREKFTNKSEETDEAPYSEDEFQKYIDKETEAIWQQITVNDGSIQELDMFSENEKLVFKTARELDQRWIIDLARDRQKYICQGQSVNLFLKEKEDASKVLEIHLRAFKKSEENDTGVPLKGLYYLRSKAGKKAEAVSERVERIALKDGEIVEKKEDNEGCLACEG